jgi:hypothetical protein
MDLHLQREFDRIELTAGLGSRELGRICVMALVALLAGECHGDCPATASPVIRALAIPLNDRMPDSVRQRLKVLAPRILGTNDGLDAARLEVLRLALRTLYLKTAGAYPASPESGGVAAMLGALAGVLRRATLLRRWTSLFMLLDRACEGGPTDLGTEAARAAGNLIAHCAIKARQTSKADWYWNEALSLLDKLCDIGAVVPLSPALPGISLLQVRPAVAPSSAMPGVSGGSWADDHPNRSVRH